MTRRYGSGETAVDAPRGVSLEIDDDETPFVSNALERSACLHEF
ncbi:MAG TPA: hypothetical protein VFW80_04290 [Gaiellaceae bacterium]|nr:hypothetical protein [Gaiellaceae bacterium]